MTISTLMQIADSVVKQVTQDLKHENRILKKFLYEIQNELTFELLMGISKKIGHKYTILSNLEGVYNKYKEERKL